MIRIILTELILLSPKVHAHRELEKFKDSYLFTHYADYTVNTPYSLKI
jgi:hypothetical protein